MKTKSNRFYSKKQEDKIAKTLDLKVTANSGATILDKGDVKGEHILIEAKTLIKPQKSHSIKKEWLDKLDEEAFSRGKHLKALAFDFGDGSNYYILDERIFKELYNLWLREVSGESEEDRES